MQMTVQGNLGDAAKLLKDFGTIERKAMVLALNRVAQQAQTAATKTMRERYAFPTKVIKGTLRIYRANNGRLQASLISKGPRVQLIHMTARQTRKGVTVRVGKSRKLIKSAFIATMQSGHVGVFTRKGKARLPIKELYTIAIPEAFASQHVGAAMRAKVNEALPARYQHELDRLAKAQAPDVVKVTSTGAGP